MDVNGSDAPEERSEPATREGETNGGEQESPEQAVEQNVVEPAVKRRISVAEETSGPVDDGPEPIEVRCGADPRDDGPVPLVEARDLRKGPGREEMGNGVHGREACLTSGISGERSESAACRG